MDTRRAGGAEGERAMFLEDETADEATGREEQIRDPRQEFVHGYSPLSSVPRETVSSGTIICGASAQSLSRS